MSKFDEVDATIVSINNNEVIFRIDLNKYPEFRDESVIGPELNTFLTQGKYPGLREVRYAVHKDYLLIFARGVVNMLKYNHVTVEQEK